MASGPEGQGDPGAHASPANRGFTFRIVETTPEGPPKWAVAVVTSWVTCIQSAPPSRALSPCSQGGLGSWSASRFRVPRRPNRGFSLPVAPAGWGPGGVGSPGAALAAWLAWGEGGGRVSPHGSTCRGPRSGSQPALPSARPTSLGHAHGREQRPLDEREPQGVCGQRALSSGPWGGRGAGWVGSLGTGNGLEHGPESVQVCVSSAAGG